MKFHVLMAAASILVLITLQAVRCQAQAEIAPDHDNETGIEPVTLPGTAIAPKPNSGELRGRFTLAYQVNYAGYTLAGRQGAGAIGDGSPRRVLGAQVAIHL